MSIQVKLSIPDELLNKTSEAVSREILEQFVIESYKLDKISTKQIQRLLGFKSRFEVEDFLHRNQAFGYTVEDLKDDLTNSTERQHLAGNKCDSTKTNLANLKVKVKI